MKRFGRRPEDEPARLPALMPGLPASATSLPASTPKHEEPSVQRPVMPASLRERVIEQIEPSVAQLFRAMFFGGSSRKSSMESPTRNGLNCQVASSFS